MAQKITSESLVEVAVTPRFETFYALQALESGSGAHLHEWRREMERVLPARLHARLAAVVPSPLMWPLLADALRDQPAQITFAEMVSALRSMDEDAFQNSVLGGVFKSPGAVEGLMSGSVSLANTVQTEAKTQQRLLSLLGLHPFSRRAPSVVAFERIVSDASGYRDEVVDSLESFWTTGFTDTWASLEPHMTRTANDMRMRIAELGFGSFASEQHLPITMDPDGVVTVRSGTRVPLRSVKTICLIPSAFNTGNLWAAYVDSHNATRYFIPILDAAPLRPRQIELDPATVFKALGDTTRYAMASMLAQNPMTSVELARAFNVSKPTISHHVQQMRAAGLLSENPADNGITLSLNRDVLERASTDAAAEMFAPGGSSEVRRSRRANST